MAMLSKLLTSCCLQHDDQEPTLAEKQPLLSSDSNPSQAHLADEIVSKIIAAENDTALQADLRSTVDACGWYDGLAEAVMERLKRAIELGEAMGPVMKNAFERAVAAFNGIKEWVKANPAKTTLIALGVLAILVPWMLMYLGFAEAGIVEGKFTLSYHTHERADEVLGSWASLWQARYQGFVPKGSLFSFLQSLGTRIGLGA
jgi:hypothetical protein